MLLNVNKNYLQSQRADIDRGQGRVEFLAEVIVVAGGGGAGDNSIGNVSAPAGGGAGSFISASWIVPPETTFDVTIGSGGAIVTDGGDTTVIANSENYFVAFGGGYGEQQDGGSGGGSQQNLPDSGGDPIPVVLYKKTEFAYPNTGSKGGRATDGGTGIWGGGGGGVNGAGTAGDATNNDGGSGGDGIPLADTFLSGSGLLPNGISLAYGGNGDSPKLATRQPAPATNSGAGGTVNLTGTGTGADGLFAIRYAGAPKATGGEIVTDGGYTIHLFTGSAQLNVIGRTDNQPY